MTIFNVRYTPNGINVYNYDYNYDHNDNDYTIVRGYKVPLNECIRFGTMGA
jgi:hypothetical protein